MLALLLTTPVFAGDGWQKVMDTVTNIGTQAIVYTKDAHMHNGIASYKMHFLVGDIKSGTYTDWKVDMMIDCFNLRMTQDNVNIVAYDSGVKDEALTQESQAILSDINGRTFRLTRLDIEKDPSFKWACSLPESK